MYDTKVNIEYDDCNHVIEENLPFYWEDDVERYGGKQIKASRLWTMVKYTKCHACRNNLQDNNVNSFTISNGVNDSGNIEIDSNGAYRYSPRIRVVNSSDDVSESSEGDILVATGDEQTTWVNTRGDNWQAVPPQDFSGASISEAARADHIHQRSPSRVNHYVPTLSDNIAAETLQEWISNSVQRANNNQ